MNKISTLFLFTVVFMIIAAVSAIDFTDWKEIAVDESAFNSSSDTVFTVMLPPGNTNSTIDSPIGPITSFLNETDSSLVTIVVIPNPIGQQLNDKNSKDYLDNFMLGMNVTPIEGSEQYLDDGGIVNYGTQGNESAGVYVMSTDEKVILVSGFYKNMDDALAGIETLAMIAGTVQIAPAEE